MSNRHRSTRGRHRPASVDPQQWLADVTEGVRAGTITPSPGVTDDELIAACAAIAAHTDRHGYFDRAAIERDLVYGPGVVRESIVTADDQRQVLMVLATFADDDGYVLMSVSEIAERATRDRADVVEILGVLVAQDIIRVAAPPPG